MRTIAWGSAAVISFWIMGGVSAQEATIGPDWQTRPSISFVTNQTGVTLQTNTVVFLAGGMNRWDADLGAWVSSVPALVVTDQGVIGRGGRHEVHFAPNINSEAATQIRLPGGQSPQWLKTHLLGLFYEDSSSGTNVLIADLQDSAAQVIGSQVWYPDAFTGIKADVRYSYTRSGVSQEIHIRERLPDPAAYNMSPGSVQLVAITEIAEGPEPQTEERLWQSGQLTERDQCLDFGSMRMVPGAAFVLGSTGNDEVAVRKEYRIIDGRRVILERVRLGLVREQLLRLPEMNSLTNGTASLTRPVRLLALGKLPPPPHGSAASLHAAQGTAFEPATALVMDWDLVHSTLRDFTFRAAPWLSYVVADDVRLGGTTTINPDAVVRFDSGSLYLDGPLNVPASLRKPVLTSMQDQSVGPALRHPEGPRVGQYVPGLVVRAQDYTYAMQQIRVRHPAARIMPDRPTSLPRVRIERGHRALATDGQPMPLKVIRTGGDMSQSLTVNYRIGATANGMEEVRISSAVIIPANTNAVEVPIPTMSQLGEDQDSSFVVTLEPDSTGTYVAEGPLAGISSLGGGGISPMLLQAPAGMVGWWKAEGNANDSSGGNRNGTAYNGATYAAGWVDQTFSFDGVNDYVEVPDSAALELTGSLTIEFWVKRQRLTGAYEYLIEKGGAWNSGHHNYAVQLHGPDNGLCFTYNNGYRIGGVINDVDNWHHCAITAVSGQANPVLYIDGWPQTISQSYGGGMSFYPSTLPLHIGAEIDPSWPFYSQTLIDEMTLYNQALSQSQIQSIFNSGRAGKTTTSQSCAPMPSGLVSWWRAENNATDSYGNTQVTFNGSYMGGEVGQAFRVVDSASAVMITGSSLNVGTGNGFTVEGWINVYDNDTAGRPVFEWSGTGYGVQLWVNYSYLGSLFVNLVDTAGLSHYYWVKSAGIQSKTMQHVALTYDHTTGYAEVFVNGASMDCRSVGSFIPQTSYPLYLGNRPANLGARSFNGVIDEASLYNRALTAAEVNAIYTAQSAGKCISAPSITIQPQSSAASVGSMVPFSVTAIGVAPLSYQWQKDGVNISGATASAYSKSNVQLADGGTYTVVVSNSGGSVTSSGASLILLPVISGQPINQTPLLGGTASFTVTATGTAPLSYQWRKDGVSIAGATTATYTINNVQVLDAGNYSAFVWNSGGNVASAQAQLVVNAAPIITTQPLGQAVAPGGTASLAVVATGLAPLTFQWKKDGVAITGATSSAYIKNSIQPSDAGNYTVLVSNSRGSASSAQATLQVSQAPVILTQPASQTVAEGANLSFTVIAGPAPLTYQWFHSGNLIAGATAWSLTLNSVQLPDAGEYLVRVSNTYGTATSLPAILEVQQEGEKHVIAMKAWHGAEPFTYDQGMGYGSWSSTDRPLTHYCTASGSATWTKDGSSATCSRWSGVSPITGLVTGTGADSGLVGTESTYCRDNAAALAVGLSMATPLWLKSFFDNAVPLVWRDGGAPSSHDTMRTEMLVNTPTAKSMNVYFHFDTGDTSGEHLFIHAEWNGAAGSYSADYYAYGFNNYTRTWSGPDHTEHQEASISLTASSCSGWSGGSSGPHETWSGSGSLSVPYTWAQLNSDVDELLSTWDLSRDGYWMRYCYDGPLVSRNEREAGVPVCRNLQGSWTGAALTQRPQFGDGAILGSPAPRETPPHQDEITGEFSPFPQATQWFSGLATIKSTPASTHFSMGAWINFNFAGDSVPAVVTYFPGYLMKAKWAQIKNTHPSYNYFRPCGVDRDLRDAQGNARFSNAWPICGRIAVAGATQSAGYVDLLLGEEAPYLRNGDGINVTGVPGLGSNLQVTQPDPENHWVFRVSGTLSGSYSSGGYVQSTGSPSYTWNDDGPKGDFTFVKRPGPEGLSTCAQGNLQDLPGALSVQYISTHAENFANAAFYPLDSVTPSIAKGAYWQGYCYSTMPDPLDPTLPPVEARCSPRPGSPPLPPGSIFGSLDGEPPWPTDCKTDNNLLTGAGVNIDIERNGVPLDEQEEDSNGGVVQIVPTANPSGLYPQGIFLSIPDLSFQPASLAHLFTLKLKKIYPADPVTHKLMSPGKIRIYKRSQGEQDFSLFMDAGVDEKPLNASLLSPNTEWKLDSTAGGVVDIAIIAEYPAGTEVDRDTVRVSSIPCEPDIYGRIIFINPMSWLAEPPYDNFSRNAAHSIADAIAIMQPEDNILIARQPDYGVYAESGIVLTQGGVIAGLGGQWTVSDPSSAPYPGSDVFDFTSLPVVDNTQGEGRSVFRATGLVEGTRLAIAGMLFKSCAAASEDSRSGGALNFDTITYQPVRIGHCQFDSNWANDFGGAIYLSSVSDALVEFSRFDGNLVDHSSTAQNEFDKGMGGAVASLNSYLVVQESSFLNNKAQVSSVNSTAPPLGSSGGGGDLYTTNGTLKVIRCKSSGATAGFRREPADADSRYMTGDGGAILVLGGGNNTLEVRDSRFVGSTCYGNGGAISISYDLSPLGRQWFVGEFGVANPPVVESPEELSGACLAAISHVDFQSCAGGWQGGAVALNGRGIQAIIEDCTFTTCNAGATQIRDGKGGAIAVCGGLQSSYGHQDSVELNRCTMTRCTASGNGGGAYATIKGYLVLLSTTIDACSAQNLAGESFGKTEGMGGGAHVTAGGELVLGNGSRLIGNYSAINGGGLSIKTGQAFVDGTVLISGNWVTYNNQEAYGNGGGVFLSTSFYDDGPPTLSNPHVGAGYGATLVFKSDGDFTSWATGTLIVQNNTATRYGGAVYVGIAPPWWDPWWHAGNYVPSILNLFGGIVGDNHAFGGIPINGPPPNVLVNSQITLERVRNDTAAARSLFGVSTQPVVNLQDVSIGGDNNVPTTDVGLHLKDSYNPVLNGGCVNVIFRNIEHTYVEQP